MSNLILIVCSAGILILFLRRAPEVIEESGQLDLGSVLDTHSKGFFGSLGAFFSEVFVRLGRKIWRFVLEAKDLKQGKILAAKFSELIPQGRRVINMGVYANLKKAESLIRQKSYVEAEQLYFEIIRKHPHEYSAYEGLINVYISQENYENIKEILQYLIKHNPQNDHYLSQLADALLKTKRYREAIPAYQRSLEMNNLVAQRFLNLGSCYEALGDLENAKKNFLQALDLDPANMQYLTIAVKTMVGLNQIEEAVIELEKALEMDKDNELIKEKLLDLKKIA